MYECIGRAMERSARFLQKDALVSQYRRLLVKWTDRPSLGCADRCALIERALKAFSVLALISTGVVLVFCTAQWLRDEPQIAQNAGLSIVEKFSQANRSSANEKGELRPLSPHVRQAQAFATYLNPAQTPSREQPAVSGGTLTRKPSRARTAESESRFRLFGTSYYRSKPEESMALVSEAGGRPRWIKQGALLGHSVVVKIMRGKIVCKDDQRQHEIAVDTKAPIPAPGAPRATLASDKTSTSAPRSSSIRTPRMKTHKLTLARPEALPTDPKARSER
jgi:hypothetical protein